MAQNPNVRFTVDSGFPDRLIGRLRLGDLDVVIGALPDNRVDPDLRFMRLTSDVIRVVGRKDPTRRKRDRTLADYAAERWILPGRQELVRRRLAHAFMLAGLPEPMLAVEDSLSLELATLKMTDCLADDNQILTHERRKASLLDHESAAIPPGSGHRQPQACRPVTVGEARDCRTAQDCGRMDRTEPGGSRHELGLPPAARAGMQHSEGTHLYPSGHGLSYAASLGEAAQTRVNIQSPRIRYGRHRCRTTPYARGGDDTHVTTNLG
jgi:hypothetical protein